VQFHNDKFANPAGLVDFLKTEGAAGRVAGNKIVLMRDWKSEGDRIKGAFAIARDLAEKVVRPDAPPKPPAPEQPKPAPKPVAKTPAPFRPVVKVTRKALPRFDKR